MTVRSEQQTRERMTVSVSRRTREIVETKARERGTDMSAVVEDAVMRLFREERRIVAQAAILEDAEEDERLAELWMQASEPLEDEGW
ncbi:MAG: hypothetical protein LH650_04015 [Chloroflexi bacterium]|nr:hypothetical protein [Chloroflexota bacterium]